MNHLSKRQRLTLLVIGTLALALELIGVSSGDYTRQIICSKTGEELNIQPAEYHEHYISCGKCGSADVEITTVEMRLWSRNNKNSFKKCLSPPKVI